MKNFRIKNTEAFTMAELIVVVTIVTLTAALALPQLVDLVERTQEENAIAQLRSIHNAQRQFFHAAENYFPGDASVQPLDDINTNLNLNIIASGFTYSCGAPDTCSAARIGGAYTIMVDPAIDLTEQDVLWGTANPNPCCSAGTCPRLQDC